MATVLVVVFALCVANLVYSVRMWRVLRLACEDVAKVRIPFGKRRAKKEGEKAGKGGVDMAELGDALGLEPYELAQIVDLARKAGKAGDVDG